MKVKETKYIGKRDLVYWAKETYYSSAISLPVSLILVSRLLPALAVSVLWWRFAKGQKRPRIERKRPSIEAKETYSI